MNDLTICSVYHSVHSKRFLELNRELVELLNPERSFDWIVVDNTSDDYTGERIDSSKFQVIRGVSMAEYQKQLKPWQESFKASMHVGYALNMAMRQVKTRYALVLDGDFYIVRKNWVDDVLAYMKGNNLALMGVPWHPRWHKKTRYFPTLHALFVDARQIPPASLDFRPQYETPDELPVDLKLSKATSLISAIKNNIRMRKLVGSSKDCAHSMYERYKESRFRYNIFTPVFKPYQKDGRVERTIKLWIDLIMPDRFSLTPRPSSYSTKSFKDRGFFDAMGKGWEEFVWKNKPFGFHMRNTGDIKRDKDEDLQILQSGLRDFKAKLNV
jgi:hypothetical protein